MARGISTRLTAAEGRRFGLTVGAAFAVLAAIILWRGAESVATGFGVVAALLILAGLVVPGHLGPVYRGWMAFALALSRVTTPIFMGIVYFVVMLPIGVLMRAFGRNPLVHGATSDSFWAVRGEDRSRSDMQRQF